MLSEVWVLNKRCVLKWYNFIQDLMEQNPVADLYVLSILDKLKNYKMIEYYERKNIIL